MLYSSHSSQEKTGVKQVIRFQKRIIAAGSAAVHLPFIPKDPRIVDSTGALEMRFVPKKMLVVGGGIIGLEMATDYSTLGTKVDVVEMLDALMQGSESCGGGLVPHLRDARVARRKHNFQMDFWLGKRGLSPSPYYSERNSQLTWGEKRGDTSCGSVEFPILGT